MNPPTGAPTPTPAIPKLGKANLKTPPIAPLAGTLADPETTPPLAVRGQDYTALGRKIKRHLLGCRLPVNGDRQGITIVVKDVHISPLIASSNEGLTKNSEEVSSEPLPNWAKYNSSSVGAGSTGTTGKVVNSPGDDPS